MYEIGIRFKYEIECQIRFRWEFRNVNWSHLLTQCTFDTNLNDIHVPYGRWMKLFLAATEQLYKFPCPSVRQTKKMFLVRGLAKKEGDFSFFILFFYWKMKKKIPYLTPCLQFYAYRRKVKKRRGPFYFILFYFIFVLSVDPSSNTKLP